MSSLARSRSLRKPTTTTSSDPSSTKDASPSRLPVKPHLRSVSTAVGGTTTSSSTNGVKSTRSTSSTLNRTASTRQTAAAEPSKREASRYPPTTASTRGLPSTRPTSSGSSQPTQTRRLPTHTRAKSTTTPTAPGSAPSLRPPSQGATTRSAAAAATRTTHARKASTERPPRAAAPTAQAPSTRITQQAQPKLRPAFSTLQQHYSPARTRDPKPLTSTYLAPPSPSKLPANVAASAETSKLQTELLQLHLLHKDAASVEEEWRASAKEKLGERFAKLSDAAEEVARRERGGLERENVLALRSWGSEGALEERIQALDGVISGLWTLSEPGGRYARMARRFEKWMDQLGEVEDARRSEASRALQPGQAIFVGELDATWKEDCPGMLRRLDGWQRQLREIGEPPQEEGTERSSLFRMLEGSRALIHEMLSELSLMEEIEQEALAREERWIERMNRDDNDDDTPRAGAIWRAI